MVITLKAFIDCIIAMYSDWSGALKGNPLGSTVSNLTFIVNKATNSALLFFRCGT
jgi:hypothetical protein